VCVCVCISANFGHALFPNGHVDRQNRRDVSRRQRYVLSVPEQMQHVHANAGGRATGGSMVHERGVHHVAAAPNRRCRVARASPVLESKFEMKWYRRRAFNFLPHRLSARGLSREIDYDDNTSSTFYYYSPYHNTSQCPCFSRPVKNRRKKRN